MEVSNILRSEVKKLKDNEGNTIIAGAKRVDGGDDLDGRRLYRFEKKNSRLSKGNLCTIKLCQDISSNEKQQYAIKRFNKLTLRK